MEGVLRVQELIGLHQTNRLAGQLVQLFSYLLLVVAIVRQFLGDHRASHQQNLSAAVHSGATGGGDAISNHRQNIGGAEDVAGAGSYIMR